MIDLIISGLARVGAVTLPVTGNSMLPTLRSGERVVLHPLEPHEIQPRDVVAYRSSGGRLVLHRVHTVLAERVITAGDNHRLLDPPVWKTDVIGVARGLAQRSAPSPWPVQPYTTAADIWLIGADANDSTSDRVVPVGWRLHRRPAEGVGVSAAVLDELQGAVAGRPCVGVTEHAVYPAAELLGGGLQPDTQVIIGCSFGRLDDPLPGRLIPEETADMYIRLGPPKVRLTPDETLRRLAALLTPGGSA